MGHSFRFALIASLLLCSHALADEPFAFKDLHLGSSLDERIGDTRFPECAAGNKVNAECVTFDTKETIAGANIQVMGLDYYERRLYKITLMVHSNLVPGIAEALEQKYGKPTSEVNETIKNRMGAEFLNTIRTWNNSRSSITTTRYAGSIKSGTVEFTLNGAAEMAREHRRDTSKKSAKDL